MSSLITLQLICKPHKSGAAAEAVVVGVDDAKDGIGVVAQVQEIVNFQAEGEAFDFVKNRDVKEGHAIILVSNELVAHVAVV